MTSSLKSPPPMASSGPLSSRLAVSNLHLSWPPMGSKGLQWAPMVRATQLMTCSLKSPPPMASYGLQWAPMARATRLKTCCLKSPPLMDSNGLQWAPMVITVWISSAMPISSISNINGLQWASMVSQSQLTSYHSKSATPLDSNGLQWAPMDSNGLQW